MAGHTEIYEGCEIEIADDTYLSINGKEIDYEYDNGRGKWVSKYLPYSEFESLLDLARAIARDSGEFSANRA